MALTGTRLVWFAATLVAITVVLLVIALVQMRRTAVVPDLR